MLLFKIFSKFYPNSANDNWTLDFLIYTREGLLLNKVFENLSFTITSVYMLNCIFIVQMYIKIVVTIFSSKF